MDSGKSTVERAIELAKSGTFKNAWQIRQQMGRERFSGLEGLFSGLSFRKQLSALIATAKACPPAEKPYAAAMDDTLNAAIARLADFRALLAAGNVAGSGCKLTVDDLDLILAQLSWPEDEPGVTRVGGE